MKMEDSKSPLMMGRTRHHRRKQPDDKQDGDHHKKHHKHQQDGQHDKKKDGSKSADQSKKAENSTQSANDSGSSPQNPQPAQPSQPAELLSQPIPIQSPSSSDMQAPVVAPEVAPSQGQPLPAVGTSSHSSTPNIAVIAGAALGGVVLLLALVSLVAYKCSRRKKPAARSKQPSRQPTMQSPWTSRTDLMGSLTDIQYPSYKADDHRQQQWPYLQRDRSRTASAQEHVQVSLPSHPVQGDGFGDTCEKRPEPITVMSEQSGVEMAQLSAVPHEPFNHHDPNLLQGSTMREAETTVEGDEAQIDRCLSYYMKRHTRASMQAEPISALPSPMPRELDFPPSPTQNSAARRSFKFAKTANLLEKIRRSQIRLNDEALSKAKNEGFRISTLPQRVATLEEERRSSASSTNSTEATKYDASSSFSPEKQGAKIPAHWRPHSKLHYQNGQQQSAGAGQDVLGSSPAVSEPHSAFEYAEYYESYLPAAAPTPAQLALTANDAEDGFAVPWGNHSPCRSSALSPRRSENASIRQRSATFNQVSPLHWPASASVETDSDAGGRGGKGHLSTVSMHRESAQVDEVIRF
ncbi:uncharacterized protein SRS1_13534 [Sporisorium reilianum f. sp. reilianum]|uniref:Uncharacterized protein n=1 Tax=Sporisorium reilianum f. sp. reilianum TaxID=72559 RepID=A0A2N8UMW5_9BASI|nr:uncharacterized protein SRS1_13534 [Sporisorium reilianum f. sp. reilianum]